MKYKLQDAQVTAKWHNRWLLLFVLFFLTTCLFAGLFGGYYSAWISLKRCPLTYDSKGAISESKMQEWASAASWSITTPKWDNDRRACVCDEDPNPLTQGTKKTPVWIAPLDLYNLFPLATYPKDFPKDAQSPKDHVKVCLERPHLDNLWNGLNATGQASGITHCHSPQPFEIFTGWDGDLYCAQTSNSCPSSQTGYCVGLSESECSKSWIYFKGATSSYNSYSCTWISTNGGYCDTSQSKCTLPKCAVHGAPSGSCDSIDINGPHFCDYYSGISRTNEGVFYHNCMYSHGQCIKGSICK